jgi:hypothetical protein
MTPSGQIEVQAYADLFAAAPPSVGAELAGSVGWLGIGGTLPKARGRGSQGAIFAARFERAREVGVTQLITETGVPRDGQPGPSYRNMLRVGFQPTYVRPNFVKP